MEDNIIYEQLIGLGDNILEALNLFVCTQSSKIINFDYTMSAFTKKIKDDFTEILSLKNSNEKHLVLLLIKPAHNAGFALEGIQSE
jgi:hypothetical protein